MTENKTILLTGAGTGIGRATVSYLATRHLRVIAGVYPDDFEEVAASNRLFDEASVDVVELDVTDPASIANALAEVKRLAGRLDGLVNNAAVSLPGPLELVSSEQWRAQLEVNVIGTMAMSRACLPLLRESRGRIVNLGSVQARLALPYSGPYCASKAAIAASTDSFRMELSPFGVSVSLIEPGYIESKMVWKSLDYWDRLAKHFDREKLEPYRTAIEAARGLANRLGHLGSPPEVVSRDIHHALTARYPRARYRPGRGAWIESYLAARLPPRWLDKIVETGFARAGGAQGSKR